MLHFEEIHVPLGERSFLFPFVDSGIQYNTKSVSHG